MLPISPVVSGGQFRAPSTISPHRPPYEATGGYKRSPLDARAELLLGLIEERPEMTVEAWLRARGIQAGHGSVWRFFARHGISFKKNRVRGRAGAARRGGRAGALAAGPGRV